jgi:bacteriorhodopsin
MALEIPALETLYILISIAVIGVLQYWRYTGRISSKKAFLHSSIVGWSALIYSNFIFQVFDTGLTYYFDWMISTPLLVLALVYSSKESLNEEAYAASITQFTIIFAGLMAVVTPFFVTFALISTGLLVVLFIQIIEIEGYKEKPVLHGILLFTWSLYPIVFFIHSGELLQAKPELFVLPLISKHLFALWDGLFTK